MLLVRSLHDTLANLPAKNFPEVDIFGLKPGSVGIGYVGGQKLHSSRLSNPTHLRVSRKVC